MRTSLLCIETLASPPITIEGAQFQVRSQLVQLKFPAAAGGVIWNRPVTVGVRTLDGEENIVPIPDLTRSILLTLIGLCFTAMLVRNSLGRKKA